MYYQNSAIMSQYEHRERQAKGFRREFRMGSLFFWDIVPHPSELVPDTVVASSMVTKSLLFLWRATKQGMEKLNILEKWHTFKFRGQVSECCSTLSIAVCSLAYWQNKCLVQSVFSTGRSKLKIQGILDCKSDVDEES
jgi:hypothetical protein